LEDCPAGNPVRNLENYLVCCSVSYRASYLERSSASCSEGYGEGNWEDSPSDCPENRRASNPESMAGPPAGSLASSDL